LKRRIKGHLKEMSGTIATPTPVGRGFIPFKGVGGFSTGAPRTGRGLKELRECILTENVAEPRLRTLTLGGRRATWMGPDAGGLQEFIKIEKRNGALLVPFVNPPTGAQGRN